MHSQKNVKKYAICVCKQDQSRAVHYGSHTNSQHTEANTIMTEDYSTYAHIWLQENVNNKKSIGRNSFQQKTTPS